MYEGGTSRVLRRGHAAWQAAHVPPEAARDLLPEDLPSHDGSRQPPLMSLTTDRPRGCERVYLPLCKVADIPFHIQGDEIFLIPVWILRAPSFVYRMVICAQFCF